MATSCVLAWRCWRLGQADDGRWPWRDQNPAGDERLNYKPCVDITFGSAAKSYGDKVLAVVLTGMGADGREGARLLKQGGSAIWAQDEASCVIYGMPMAIVKAELADAIYSLDDIGRHLVEACL